MNGAPPIRDSVLRVLDRLSTAFAALDSLSKDLLATPINAEEMHWLGWGLGQLSAPYLERLDSLCTRHGVVHVSDRMVQSARARLLLYAPKLADLGIEAFKEGLRSNAQSPPHV